MAGHTGAVSAAGDSETPVGKGKAGAGYPWPWSVYTWLAGDTAKLDRLADPAAAALALAGFIRDLQAIDAREGPAPGRAQLGPGGFRWLSGDAATRKAIRELEGKIDTSTALALWIEASVVIPAYAGAGVWIHGDLMSENMLVVDGALRAVIDFGCLGVGDPACDLQVAWNLFGAQARAAFREAMGVDDATWARGRGWALSVALIQLPYYETRNPTLAGIARRTIAEVLMGGQA